jgi:hypothetical protein
VSNENSSHTATIAKSVEKISDSKGLAAIGVGLGWGIASVACAGIFIAIAWSGAASKWDGHLVQQTKCFDVKEVSGRAYKVNTCTGEAEELKPTAASLTDPTHKKMPLASSTQSDSEKK